MDNYFTTLYQVNVNDKVEKKNGLSYVSWPFAWAEVKKRFPDATYCIYERDGQYGPVNYFTDGRTCWVKTGLTINGIEHIEELPVMDFKNKSIPYESVNSMDVNKAIQRSLTKAAARHGLGLYIYAGEDLPEGEEEKPDPKKLRLETINRFCGEKTISQKQFGEIRNVAVANSVIPDKRVMDLTDAEFVALMVFAEQNYG